jgi:hypothetical protein
LIFPSALPSTFAAAGFDGGCSVGSVEIEDDDATVFAGDFDGLADIRALVE